MKPTIVLIHGAYAESASWNGVTSRLQAAGHRVIAAANPLRSLSGDAAFLASLLDSIDGPIVLVGHSYGGMVASNAATGNDNVKALVYVASLAPEKGENVPDLVGKFPGAVLGEAVTGVPLPDGATDNYVDQAKYHAYFAADLSPQQAALDAAAQRPVTDIALEEPSGEPAWNTIPSWFIYAGKDLAIPAEASRFMAERANAREAIEVPGASHALPASQPQAVADMILRAVAAV
jgi:pimeloyl-ACP methyl ester carboxylesterase